MAGYSTPKLSIKDSYDEDDVSDDVEDEVFIRDGRNGFKIDEEVGVKRPLMAPRRKYKSSGQYNGDVAKPPRCKTCRTPYCYVMLAVFTFLGLAIGVFMLLNVFPVPLEKLKQWAGRGKPHRSIIPCTEFNTSDIWSQSFPLLKSEAAITSALLNQDAVPDFIIGFSTAEEQTMPQVCGEYKGARDRCGGGAVALDGKTGAVLWTHWTRQDVLFVDCVANVNTEKTNDCVLSGKGGVLVTVDGLTGELIWELAKPPVISQVNVYSAQYIPDMNSDGILDVLVAHTSEETGHLLIVDGRNGKVIGQVESPNKEGIFTVPRLHVGVDGSSIVIFATGTVDTPGALYVIPLYSIALSDPTKIKKVWNDSSGISSGIVMGDMNLDGMEDIILTHGEKLSVINGVNFTQMWNLTLPSTSVANQLLIGPTPGYFDDDLLPDLLITFLLGPAFPTYYYSETIIANGKGNGENLLANPIIGAGEITAPGLIISFSGIGNDMFLYWLTNCKLTDTKSQMSPFTFAQGSTLHQQTHADLCKLRFNTSLDIKLYLISQHIEPPGILLYSSELHSSIERNVSIDQKKTEKVEEPPPQQQWTPPAQHSSFRHKSQMPTRMQYPQQPSIPESIPMLSYPRFSQRPSWDPQSISYGEALGYQNGNVGDFIGEENLFPQEGEEQPPDGIPIGEGRDERADPRRKRSTPNSFLPRASGTAILADSLDGEGIDVVYLSYWEIAANNVRVLSERDQECVRNKAAKEQLSPNKLTNLEPLQGDAERECLGYPPYPSPDTGKVGQMTVYRTKLVCKCSSLQKEKEKCSVPLSIEKQSYSHRAGDAYFKRRYSPQDL